MDSTTTFLDGSTSSGDYLSQFLNPVVTPYDTADNGVSGTPATGYTASSPAWYTELLNSVLGVGTAATTAVLTPSDKALTPAQLAKLTPAQRVAAGYPATTAATSGNLTTYLIAGGAALVLLVLAVVLFRKP